MNLSDKTRAVLTRTGEVFAFAFLSVEVIAPTTDLLSVSTIKAAALSGVAAVVAFAYNALRGPATHGG